MKIVLDENARMPKKAHKLDAGFDLYSSRWTCISYGASTDIDTGVHIEIPSGYVGLVLPKSGLMFNHNVVADVGVIDAGYTGSIKVHITNRDRNKLFYIEEHQKIAQLVILRLNEESLELAEELQETERGVNGFGSTGSM